MSKKGSEKLLSRSAYESMDGDSESCSSYLESSCCLRMAGGKNISVDIIPTSTIAALVMHISLGEPALLKYEKTNPVITGARVLQIPSAADLRP